MDKYSILVNTCDKFEDCWSPFFKLFTTYWKDYKGKIYLNTENKDYFHKGLNIISVKVCQANQNTKRLTWSECLIRALETIEDDIVLYMQEDYFLKDTVKNDIIDDYVQLMNDNKEIDCIHLTDQSLIAEEKHSKYEKLNLVNQSQRYLVNCQVALWRKDTLKSFLRSYESAWEFEEFGSKRAAILKPSFYIVDKNWVKLNQFEIVPYIFTGIIQGRWFKEVVPLFERNEIQLDFTKRGFVQDAPKRTIKVKIKNKLKRIPIIYKNYLDLRKLSHS